MKWRAFSLGNDKKMIEIKVASIQLPLKNPFHIAHGSSDFRENVFLQLHSERLVAYGEAAVVPYYGVTKQQIIEDLEKHITGEMVQQRQTLSVSHRFSHSMSACAYSSAILALQMQEKQETAQQVLGIHQDFYDSQTSFTIAYSEDLNKMLETIANSGFSIIKLKAGFPDDLERLQLIRKEFPRLRIRIDANQGWAFEHAKMMIRNLETLDIELIEEPISGTVEQLKALKELGTIPILLDETVQNIQDLRRYAGSVSGIVVKLAKSGGPQASLKLVEEATKLGLDVMLSCMVESSLGIASALSLAPLCKWVDLDAPQLLAWDAFTPIQYLEGRPIGSLGSTLPAPELLAVFERTKPLVLE